MVPTLTNSVSIQEIIKEMKHLLPKREGEISRFNLKDNLCLDSLDIVEVIVHLEKKYGIEFDGDTMPSVETVGDLARYTQSLVTEKVKI